MMMKAGAKAILLMLLLVLLIQPACQAEQPAKENRNAEYTCEVVPLERNGVSLHLDCMKCEDAQPGKNILLIHGVTYSSHEFDVDYQDYSLVRFLAQEGYAVWRLDIAGFGRSGAVSDGFLPDSDYAAEDIRAAVECIVALTGQERIDLLGWSWGTVTAGRFAANHPEHIEKLVLYAPIIAGLGEAEITEPFHRNTWEHAAGDFQTDSSGSYDEAITDPMVLNLFCSNAWRYDGESSPNGGRRDLCVSESETLFDLEKITAPVLLIYGGSDPYLNYERLSEAAASLPEGSRVTVIPGGSHVVYIEKPYYREFQETLAEFLKK